MASHTPTVSINDPTTTTGGNGGLPPHWGGDGDNIGSPFFDTRLRRARLGLVVGLTGIAMIFISFTSAYIVRQGLPTLDPRTNVLLHDWFPVPLPKLMLINTAVLLVSTFTMELARRQAARNAAVAQLAAIPGVSVDADEKVSWLALTVVLGLSFLVGQWMVWRELAASGFYVSSSPSSSFVYLLTGMHGVPAPVRRFTINSGGRNRLVLALHGLLVGVHLVLTGVCALTPREGGDQTHG